MNNDPLRIFEPGFSGDSADSADTRAREVIDAWRDEWHLEPEPELDGANSEVYESLVRHVADALRAATPHPAATEAGEQERLLFAADVCRNQQYRIGELERHRQQLLLYASHLSGCTSYTNQPCTCGLESTMRGIDPAPPSTSPAIRAAADEIDALLVPLKEYSKTPGIDAYAAILSRWFGKGETDKSFVNEFTEATIEAHVGYHHEKTFHDCDYAICAKRREMIDALHTAAHGSPSPAEPRDTCAWTLDDVMDGDVWETGCGETFQFTDGGPVDNNFVFCYKCGKRIDPGKYSDSSSVEGESE